MGRSFLQQGPFASEGVELTVSPRPARLRFDLERTERRHRGICLYEKQTWRTKAVQLSKRWKLVSDLLRAVGMAFGMSVSLTTTLFLANGGRPGQGTTR